MFPSPQITLLLLCSRKHNFVNNTKHCANKHTSQMNHKVGSENLLIEVSAGILGNLNYFDNYSNSTLSFLGRNTVLGYNLPLPGNVERCARVLCLTSSILDEECISNIIRMYWGLKILGLMVKYGNIIFITSHFTWGKKVVVSWHKETVTIFMSLKFINQNLWWFSIEYKSLGTFLCSFIGSRVPTPEEYERGDFIPTFLTERKKRPFPYRIPPLIYYILSLELC